MVGQHGNTAHPYTEFYNKRYQLTTINYLVCMMRRGVGGRRNDSRETDGGKGNRLGRGGGGLAEVGRIGKMFNDAAFPPSLHSLLNTNSPLT